MEVGSSARRRIEAEGCLESTPLRGMALGVPALIALFRETKSLFPLKPFTKLFSKISRGEWDGFHPITHDPHRTVKDVSKQFHTFDLL